MQSRRQPGEKVDHEDGTEAVRDDRDAPGLRKAGEDGPPRCMAMPTRAAVGRDPLHRAGDRIRQWGIAEEAGMDRTGRVARLLDCLGERFAPDEEVSPSVVASTRRRCRPFHAWCVAVVAGEEGHEVVGLDDAIAVRADHRIAECTEPGVERAEPSLP